MKCFSSIDVYCILLYIYIFYIFVFICQTLNFTENLWPTERARNTEVKKLNKNNIIYFQNVIIHNNSDWIVYKYNYLSIAECRKNVDRYINRYHFITNLILILHDEWLILTAFRSLLVRWDSSNIYISHPWLRCSVAVHNQAKIISVIII